MLVHVAVFGLVCGFVSLGMAQLWLGPGKWTILNLRNCEDDADMPWRLNVKRHKFNRTHDAFNFDVSLLDDVDESCGISLHICKMVDGGCKPFSTRTFDSLPRFLNTYIGRDNTERGLAAFHLDPPQFPVPKGEYQIDDYNLDLDDLRNKIVYGQYGSRSYLVKGGVNVACLMVYVKFERSENFGTSS